MCVSVCVCVSFASDSSETIEVTIVKQDAVIASDMRMHNVLIVLTLTFIQGDTDLNHNYSSNANHVCCEDSLYDHCQSCDLDLHSRSQERLKLDYVLTCTISGNI